MKKALSLLSVVLLTLGSVFAQIDPAAFQDQFEELGLDEQEVIDRLAEKGIDLDNVGPEDITEVQQAVEEVIAEMEAEAAAAAIADPADTQDDTSGTDSDAPAAEQPPKSPPPAVSQPSTTPPAQPSAQADTSLAVAVDTSTMPENTDPTTDVFGHQLFSGIGAIVQMDPLNVKAPGSYQLGPGDEIAISIFGVSQASFVFEINDQGYIEPPGMTRIYLKGISLRRAQTLLANRFREYYAFGAGEFEVNISYSRVIQVNLVGEVEKPGSYTIPAANTIFNALVAAGGPSDIGTVRRIRLLRDGENPREFDLYDFLSDPTLETEFYLQANDYIYVPVQEKVVFIEGAVRRPYGYELTADENLMDLLALAGGLQDDAYRGNVQITRLGPDQEEIIDVNLQELIDAGTDFDLKAGDRVVVRKIERTYENYVAINGPVRFDGQYQLTNGMRVSDLVARGVLKREARRDVAYLFRTKDDDRLDLIAIDLAAVLANPNDSANIALQPRDELQVFSQSTYVDQAVLSTTGAVRTPYQMQYDPTEPVRVSDLIILSGGVLPNTAEFAYVKRIDLANDREIDYIRINVYDILRDTTSLDNLLLEANDQVIFYTNEQFSDQFNIVVEGAVRSPGEYDFDEGLRVTDVIYFSDGLKPEAAEVAYINRTNLQTKEIEYIRIDLAEIMENPASPQNLQMQPFDKLDVLNKTTFIDESTVSVSGAVRSPGTYKYDKSLDLVDALTLAGGLKLEAARNRVEVSRVVIRNNQPTQTVVAIVEVDENLRPLNGGDGGEFLLQPFDQIIVRTVPEFELQQNISIEGEVNYPGAHPLLSDNERISSLIERAGGLTEEAFPDGATLLRAEDGVGYIIMDLEEALKKKGSRFDYILKPGDIITVPTKKDFVTVQGETKAYELYTEDVLKAGKIVVPFHKGKRAGFYVRKYAAGVGENGKASLITVLHPNGEVKKTINLGIFLIPPKVRKGSVVTVGKKPAEELEVAESGEKEEIDWGKVVADSIAQATAILSLILLIQNVN